MKEKKQFKKDAVKPMFDKKTKKVDKPSAKADKKTKPLRDGKIDKKDAKKIEREPKAVKAKKVVDGMPVCPVNKKCGGCQFQGTEYKRQLSLKQRQAKQLLGRFGEVLPIIGMEHPYHYRNKVHAVFGYEKGQVIAGTYQQGTHKIVPVESCMIDDEKSDAIIGTIRSLLKSFKIKTYNEDTGYGLLRHVLIRRGFASGEIMVVLVTASPVFPSRNNFVKALRKEHPEITTVVLNINDQQTSMVLGERNITLYGKGFITDTLCGHSFAISPSAFYQVNPVQTEILYKTAMEYAHLTGKERVVDAYCGIGTIGMIAADHAKEVIGVELNPSAVKDARNNAKHNKVNNITFYQNDATRFLNGMQEAKAHADVIFMDPPRSGSTESFMSSAIALQPERIVYISCNPETLARDLMYFKKRQYKAEKIQPVDMFPHTTHLETVCLLSRK